MVDQDTLRTCELKKGIDYIGSNSTVENIVPFEVDVHTYATFSN